MNYQIKSDELRVTVSTKGGEFVSIKDIAGTEYLWQGDPNYWAGQSPICFPIVGSLRKKTASIGNGKTCTMERHGVVKGQEFTVVEDTDDAVVLAFCSNQETLNRYPFKFELQVRYQVSGKTLTTTFTVWNHDQEPMPYQIGGHPAFNCPIGDDGKFEDYVVEFAQEETLTVPFPVIETGLLNVKKRTKLLDHSNILKMDHSLFLVDALFFDKLKSRKVSLKNPESGRGLSMDFHEFQNFVIWSTRTGAPFVALEPWNGLSTCSDEDDIFEHKRGITILAPGESKSHSYTITIL